MTEPRRCHVCLTPLDVPPAHGEKEGATAYAARAIPKVGVVEVCSELCAADPKFSLRRPRKKKR